MSSNLSILKLLNHIDQIFNTDRQTVAKIHKPSEHKSIYLREAFQPNKRGNFGIIETFPYKVGEKNLLIQSV